jgi:hypothetical protein
MKGLKLDEKDKIVGKTVLHLCAERDDKDGVQMLLQAGADPTIKDNNNKLAHELPKNMEITEMLGGNPLKVTQRRKAEAEMELRALKIEQLEVERKRERKGKVLVNPKKLKIPGQLPPSANLGSSRHQWTSSTMQTSSTPVSAQPGLIHLPPTHVLPPTPIQPPVQQQQPIHSIAPPVYVHPKTTTVTQSAVGLPQLQNKIKLSTTTLPKMEKKKDPDLFDLVLPQDRNKKYESHSGSDSDDSERGNDRRNDRRRW